MADSYKSSGRRVRLSIDVDPDLKRRIKIAAAERDLSIKDYLEMVVRRELESVAPEASSMIAASSSMIEALSEDEDADWGPEPISRPAARESARDTRYWET